MMDEEKVGVMSEDNITNFMGARIAQHQRRPAWQKDYLQSLIAALQKLPQEARLYAIVSACNHADWRAITELDPEDIWDDDDQPA
jgi:hypothetical protein